MAEFKAATVANVKMKVSLNEAGTIAQTGDTLKGTKQPTNPGIKAAATLAEATAVWDAFYGTIGGATFDSLSAVKNITQEVDN